jgi:hypothetical protein
LTGFWPNLPPARFWQNHRLLNDFLGGWSGCAGLRSRSGPSFLGLNPYHPGRFVSAFNCITQIRPDNAEVRKKEKHFEKAKFFAEK